MYPKGSDARVETQCHFCGKSILRYPLEISRAAVFCNRACYNAQRQANRIVWICQRCGVEPTTPDKQFCDNCRYPNKKIYTCANCGVDLGTPKRKYCSDECRYACAPPPAKVSKLEAIVAQELENRRLLYDAQIKMGRFRPDFVIGQTVVEVDGDYWHSLPGIPEKDARKDSFYRENGFDVIHIWEHEVKAADFSKLDALVA